MLLLQVLNFRGKMGDNMVEKNYLHTAYAYSADGTDRFTTVYPNLNLLTDSNLFSNKDGVGIKQTTSIVAVNGKKLIDNSGDTYLEFVTDGTNLNTHTKDWFRSYLIGEPGSINFTNINVTPSTVYTFSAYMRGTGQHIIYAYNSWTSSPPTRTLRFDLTPNWTLYTFTVTSNKTVDFSKTAQFFIRSEFASTIDIKKPKVELGSIATPWMPSASEVTSKDYPTYIGTYTDENENSSTNPANYTWEMMNYRIYLDGIAVAGSKLLSSKVENLKPNTSYTIQVKQVSEEEESDFSDSVTFKTNVQK